MNDQLTPDPWKWVFMGSAGNYYLVGNNGEGPVTHSGPDCADGRLKEAAPMLLEACEAFVQAWKHSHQLEKTDVALRLAEAAIAAVRGEG